MVRSSAGGAFAFEEFWNRQDVYPGAKDAVFEPVSFSGVAGIEGLVIFKLVSFPSEESASLFHDSLVDHLGSRYLRAPLGESADQPSGLMTWWTV